MTEVPKATAWKHSISGRASEQSQAGEIRSDAPPTSWRRLEAPFFYAANAQVLISGNSATLLFTRLHPAVLPDGNIAPTPLREPVALVEMSLAALRELSRAAADVIRKAEQSGETATHAMRAGDAVPEAVPNHAGGDESPKPETSLSNFRPESSRSE